MSYFLVLSVFAILAGLILAASLVAGVESFGSLWVVVTNLGSMEFYVAVLPVVYHSLRRPDSIALSFSLLTAGTLVGVVKDVVKLERPPTALSEGYGFPSGHSAGSAAFWGFLALRESSASLALLALTVAGLVGLSRVVLGEHYPRDVAGGLLLGSFAAAVSLALLEKLGYARLVWLSLGAGVAGLALFHAGLGSLEPPSVLVGFALAELLSERVSKLRVERAGALLGALGSISAGVAVALAGLVEHVLAQVAFFIVAGAVAVIVPRAALAVVGKLRGGGG